LPEEHKNYQDPRFLKFPSQKKPLGISTFRIAVNDIAPADNWPVSLLLVSRSLIPQLLIPVALLQIVKKNYTV
jgi:hypothetical protein